MKKMQGPVYEFGFYIHGAPNSEMMGRLTKAVLNHGGKPIGSALVCSRSQLDSKAFHTLWDLDYTSTDIADNHDLLRIVNDSQRQVLRYDILNATGTSNSIMELVRFAQVSDAASEVCQHPVAVATSGDAINWYYISGSSQTLQNRAVMLSKRAYIRFISLVSEIKPSYAAITCEASLECPYDLLHDPLDHSTFYVSHDYVGMEGIERIRELYAGSYCEDIGTGIYVDCDGLFSPKANPNAKTQPPRYDESAVVSRILGRAGKNW